MHHDAATFAARRDRICATLGHQGVAIFHAGHETIRSHDTEHPFRAASDVLYLTGFEEPDAIVVLAPGHESGPLIMFVRPRDPDKETWTGRRAGVAGAQERFGATLAWPLSDLDEQLDVLLEDAQTLWIQLGANPALDQRVLASMARLRGRRGKPPAGPRELRDARDLTWPLRLIKDPDEIALLQRACDITAEAHTNAMRACRPGMHEYQLQALIEFTFKRHGALATSYNTIVGAGENATILHYTENRAPIREGDLVLVDAGAEYRYYAADITRTFPASGRFTPAQRDVYQLVLEAEEAAIAMCTPGTTAEAIHQATARRLTQGMLDLGLLPEGSVDGHIESERYKRFYMHRTGHWLGIDVHDVGGYYVGKEPRPLVPGVVQTIEPGLYIPTGDDTIPRELQGIGVRIEDDVLTRADGPPLVLTAACPKAVAEVEAIVGSGYTLTL